MSEIVSYCCASCGGGAKKIIGDKFDCTFCGNTNKIINEREVISLKSKNQDKLIVPETLNLEKKPLTKNTKIFLIIAVIFAGIVGLYLLHRYKQKRILP